MRTSILISLAAVSALLAGCASISLADGGHNAVAVYDTLRQTHLAPPEYRVTPHLPFPHEKLEAARTAQVPPLLKGYLRSGAWICGEPAWDPDFESADLFLLLPLAAAIVLPVVAVCALSDAILVAAARDAEHLHMLREVGFASALIVPRRTESRTWSPGSMAE